MAQQFTLSEINKSRYRPTAEAEDILDDLNRTFVRGDKFHVAKLAIARSLAETTEPEPIGKSVDRGGTIIPGFTLFQDDASVWACMIVEASSQNICAIDQFRSLVEAHWSRGALLLQKDMEGSAGEQREIAFVNTLAAMAGTAHRAKEPAVQTPQWHGRVTVKIGEVSTELKSQRPVTVTLNGPGVSPHISVLGKTRSGKTRTGLAIAEQIGKMPNFPILLIDPKGEFVKDGKFVEKSDWKGKTLADRFLGIRAVDVPRQPVPLDFLFRGDAESQFDINQAALSFKDSFQKCVRHRGDVALDSLRQSVATLLSNGSSPISIDDIRDEVHNQNQLAGGGKNTIEAKLNELCSIPLFEPKIPPAEFFAGRWAIGLAGASDESKRLTIFLLLDAMSRYLLRLQDSDVDGGGHRSLRNLLVIDEAKEILSYKHNALSDLVRKSAAKGGVVMLLSQSPDDFAQEADDFLSQLGTIAVFASSTSSVKNLRPVLGRKVEPENFSDRELPPGVALVKVPNQDLMKITAWR